MKVNRSPALGLRVWYRGAAGKASRNNEARIQQGPQFTFNQESCPLCGCLSFLGLQKVRVQRPRSSSLEKKTDFLISPWGMWAEHVSYFSRKWQ